MGIAVAISLAGCSPSTPPAASTSGGPGPSALGSSGPSSAPIAPACPAGSSVAPGGASPAGLGQPGWWRGRVFYEVFVRSFADSDGDGIGDLPGLTAHLDALNDGDPATTTDLGIAGIWLMPIASSPSYHGYDVSDETAVETDYGTLADLKALVAAAHERGIAVITDLVLNHTSDEHPWFVDSLARTGHEDWYIWSDTNPGYGGPDGQNVWHPAGDRYFYGLFGSGLPDLNLRNPAVTAAMEDVARFWLTEAGLDGFRLDAIKHLVEDGQSQAHTPETHAWLEAFRTTIRQTSPNALLLGEVYDVSVAVARYVPEDVDLAFDFERAQATIDSLRRGDGAALTSALTEDLRLYLPGETAGFLTNHDQERVASQLRDDPGALRLAAGLLLTSSETPFLYYGEEIGLTGVKPDETIRTPLPWTGEGPGAGFTTGEPWEPLEAGWETRNVAAQSADPASLLSAYRSLVRLRDAHPALQAGLTVPLLASESPIAGFLRVTPGEQLAVIANTSDRALAGPTIETDGDNGPLCGGSTARVVYRSGTADPASVAVTAPVIGPGGGVTGWSPLTELPPRSLTVIELGR